MLATASTTPLFDFLEEFQRADISQPVIWMQAIVLFGFAFASWLISRALKPRIRAEGERKQWRFGTEGVARVLFPLIYWLGTEAATALWRTGHSVALLRLAASLGFALVVVRAAVYLLQAAFVEAEWVRRHERIIAGCIWLVYVLQLTGVLPLFADQLDQIGVVAGHQHVTLLMIVNGLFSVALTLLLALWLGRIAESRLMRVDSIDLSLRVVLTKVMRTLLVVLAVMIALPLVGIDLTVLSVFGGALGVGLGFGLQKVASNYVSGFIILLDGSIRIGDLVNIDTRQGTITKITARYVVLKLSDGTEAIIPNEALITSTVLNLSHSDRLLRVPVNVQVAYGTDLERATALLLATTQGEARVLAEPAAQVYVKSFLDNGIELELAVWINDPQEGTLGLKSSINMKIWRSFATNGIDIPMPQRTVRLIDPEKPSPKLI